MSIRARLLSATLRQFAKPREDVDAHAFVRSTREALARVIGAVPRPPWFVRIERLERAGVRGEWVRARRCDPTRVLLYVHGGSYVAGSPESHRNIVWRLADQAACQVLSLDYRLAPEHPYPAGVQDVLRAHRWLLDHPEVSSLAWCGDSAGAGLMLAALREAEAQGLSLPRSVAALSPFCDLAGRGASWRDNAARDPWLTPQSLKATAALYLAGVAPDDPRVSAAYADFQSPPPALIQVGESEVLRDDARAVAARLRAAEGRVELQIWPDVPHTWHLFAPMLPESEAALRQVGRFLSAHW